MRKVKTHQKIKIVLLVTGLFLWLFSTHVFSVENFKINLDQAQFLGTDKQSYLEIYYSYPENSLQYQKKENNQFGSEVYFTLVIYQNDSLWANKQWKIENQVADTTSLSNSKKHLVDLLRYPIQGGNQYAIHLYARDYYSGKMDSTKSLYTVKKCSEDQVCLSDLLIASNIQPFTQTSDPKFRKKNYEIVPNPKLFFGFDLHELFYYFEMNHLTQIKPDSQYAVLWQIQDSTGTVVLSNKDNLDWRPLVNESSREIGQIGVWELPNGQYQLSCYLQTSSGKFSGIASHKKFCVRKSAVQVASADNQAAPIEPLTFLDGFNEKQIDQEYDQMYALTTRDIRKHYAKLKILEEKKSMLYNLWTMNATLFGLSARDFRYDFLERIKEAHDKYKNSFKVGWKTDQGITFLKYGPPSDIERHPSEAGTKPYEVWVYEELEGGVVFVFIDRTGFNQFELIHSSKRGELSDPNWQRYIATNPTERY